MARNRNIDAERTRTRGTARQEFIEGKRAGKEYMAVLIDQKISSRERGAIFDEALEEKRGRKRR